mmetsp:Transcript_23539/g.39478  ORF Transcript_23539/g.39478 Transcript_23539/m.39478 type:complete len:202 (+) Transcript_23539:257-862(+)
MDVLRHHEGFLSKMRSTRWPHVWQKRFFRLRGNELSWAQSDETEELGRMLLSRIVWVTGALLAPHELNFRAFQSNKSRERLFELRASTGEECAVWRNLLLQATEGQSDRKQISPSGYTFAPAQTPRTDPHKEPHKESQIDGGTQISEPVRIPSFSSGRSSGPKWDPSFDAKVDSNVGSNVVDLRMSVDPIRESMVDPLGLL